LHFDLDPVDGTPFPVVREAALIMRDVLQGIGMTPYVKTTGSTGMHVYVAIRVGPTQHEVWEIAKAIGHQTAKAHPEVLTAEYRVAKRPAGRVLVDYNQNAFGQTLASIYSVRPNEAATVSAPVTWDEVEAGCDTSDFTIFNVPDRIAKLGDLWKPLLRSTGRYKLVV
jgi:bifunctional non-homologous end joining protein LigD